MSEMTAETTSSTLAGTVRAPTSVWAWYKAGGDILVFISIWLASTLFAGQDMIIEKWSFRYLLAVVPAVVFPILRFKQTLNNLLFGGARPIVVFGVAGLIWLLASGDLAGIPPLFLIVWVAGWVCRAEVSIVRKHLFALAVCFYAVAVFAYAASYSLVDLSAPEYSWMKSPLWEPVPAEPDAEVASPEITSPEVASPEVASSGSAPTESHELLLPDQTRAGINLNPWGVLPHQTIPIFGPNWRISATPSLSTSALFSFFILLIFVGRPAVRPTAMVAGATSAYFAVFSFVRGVITGLGLFAATYLLLLYTKRWPRMRLVIIACTTIGLVIATGSIVPWLIYHSQDNALFSRLFLRGYSGLSLSDIYRQMYRPWLWMQHLDVFLNSDYLMGAGSFLKESASENILYAHQIRSDSDSFLTRLLATYGLPFFGLLYFFVKRACAHARSGDLWALAMISTVIWLMMTWGSSFHPSNGIFVLAFLAIGKGSSAFTDYKRDQTAVPAASRQTVPSDQIGLAKSLR